MKYDIQGYLLKNASMEELKKALSQIAAGEKYFSKEINILDTEQDFRNTITIEDKKVEEILSRREIEILTLICKEFSNSEIAEKLVPEREYRGNPSQEPDCQTGREQYCWTGKIRPRRTS